MKKSKIIIPAAAILALSVGASITGTVAWFTASRTTNFGVNNLAVINTAGDLGVTLAKGTGTEVVNGETKSVTLSYLKDASYDAIYDKVYVATLNSDGSKINGTREVTKDLSQKVGITNSGTTTYQSVYVINEWSATFSTSSVSVNYLYFNPIVSKINDSVDTNSVYKSVRLAMRNTAEGDKHTVIWAPYTSDGTVYYVDNAGNLAEPQDSKIAPVPSDYVTTESTSLVGKYTDVASKNLVATSLDSLVSEGVSLEDATTNCKALLSTKLQGTGEGITATSPTINFTLWFEGLDPNCISASTIEDVSTKTAQVVKSMSLSFYAVDSTTLG